MKNLYLILSCILLVLGATAPSISSADWDNIKFYDEDTKTYTIENALGLGSTIAQVQLLTPYNVQVGLGYQKVAEIKINSMMDYEEALKEMKFYDKKKTNWEDYELPREFYYKYKTIDKVEVDDYKEVCVTEDNETVCRNLVSGKKSIDKLVWKDLDSKDLKKDEILTIGIFTDVKEGDYVEWIPTFFGEELTKWASWNASLNTDIISYYAMNDTTGVALDTLDNHNGTISGVDQGENGLINYSYGFIPNDYINFPKPFTDDQSFSIAGWINCTDWTAGGSSPDQTKLFDYNGDTFITYYTATNEILYQLGDGGTSYGNTITYELPESEWIHYAFVYNNATNNLSLWINGTLVDDLTASGFTNGSNSFYMGTRAGNPTKDQLEGYLDEIGLWGRALTDEEVDLLYNNHTGITYGEGEAPDVNETVITLNSPVDFYNSTSPTVAFNCSGTYATRLELIINDTLMDFITNSTPNENLTYADSISSIPNGNHTWTCNATDSEGTETQGDIRNFSVSYDAIITLNSPANDTSFGVSDIFFNCTGTNSVRLELIINDTLMDFITNSTPDETLTYANTTYGIPDGTHNWTCNSTDSFGTEEQGELRIFEVDTTAPMINITYPKGTEDYAYTDKNETLNYSIVGSRDSCWYFFENDSQIFSYDAILNSLFDGNITAKTNLTAGDSGSFYASGVNLNITQSNYKFGCSNELSIDQYNITDCQTRRIDVNVTTDGSSTYYNFTCGSKLIKEFSHGNFASCPYKISEVQGIGQNETELNCTEEVAYFTLGDERIITVFVNDSFGNTDSDTTTWDYSVFENSRTYNNETTSGLTEDFSINFTFDSTFTGISVLLNYNNTNYSASTSDSGYTREYTASAIAPTVYATDDIEFNWIIQLTNATATYTIQTLSNNQSVNPFEVGNCTYYNNTLMNFTMVDEESLEEINGTILITLKMYSFNDFDNIVFSYNDSIDYVVGGDFAICSDDISGDYTMAYELQHYGNESIYFKKSKNVQNLTISNGITPQNLTLYNLLQDSGDTYEVIVVGNIYSSSLNADLLVTTQRQYIDLDTYYDVESSVTNTQGVAISHLTSETQKYIFIVSYYGEVLGTFTNYKVKCQNELTPQCTISLNLAQSVADLPDFDTYGGIDQSFLLDEDNNILYQTFVSNDGESHTVQSLVIRNDGYGNTTICNNSATGTSGTLVCTIPSAYQNTSFIVQTTVDTQYVGSKLFSQGETPDWKGVDIFIELLMISALALLFIAHPITIIIGVIIALLSPILLLFILGGSLITIMGAVLYYIIAGGIAIYQIAKKM